MKEEDSRITKKKQTSVITPARRKRINRLKKIILTTVALLILLPVTGCIFLGVKVSRLNRDLESMSMQVKWLERSLWDVKDENDRAKALLSINAEMQHTQEAATPEAMGAPIAGESVSGNDLIQEGQRKVYLTFDDGPSIYTDDILDILGEYGVKATFFVTGRGKEDYLDAYRRIVEEGHTLGMHSYSHEYSRIYASLGDFQADLEQLRELLYQETGVISNYYRFPGGSSNTVSRTDVQELITYLDAMDITYYDWNISGGDAVQGGISSSQIVSRVVSQLASHEEAFVLLHDAGDKRSTVDALPEIIERIQDMEDTVILPITKDTVPIQHVQKSQ